MAQQADEGSELNWLLDNLVERVVPVQHGVVLSRDGLAIASSHDLERDDAEHLAAVSASFQSLARGTGQHFQGGDVRQTVVEMDTAFLFVTAAGHGACLAVLSDADSDVGLVAYEMAMLVKRVGQHLSANPRLAAHGAEDM